MNSSVHGAVAQIPVFFLRPNHPSLSTLSSLSNLPPICTVFPHAHANAQLSTERTLLQELGGPGHSSVFSASARPRGGPVLCTAQRRVSPARRLPASETAAAAGMFREPT
ncbi:unnamed protein product [Polarella glacialis]|uniref:Uncharacterized protein n=1 Tax=Polarella glacialis TaxID=89957 RepID=A0A813G444_POLGL|nr:unnamed protein product [Polarella glacialis]